MMSYIISTTTILDKIDGKFRLSISSRIKDDKMVRCGFWAPSSLISGGLGFAVLFFTVLDCCITHTLYGMLSYFPASLYRYFTVSYGWAKTIQIRYVWTGIWKEGENQSLQEADFQKNKTLYSVIILSWSGIHGIFKGCFNIDCPKEFYCCFLFSCTESPLISLVKYLYCNEPHPYFK